jgi:hypothetical protein
MFYHSANTGTAETFTHTHICEKKMDEQMGQLYLPLHCPQPYVFPSIDIVSRLTECNSGPGMASFGLSIAILYLQI